MMGRRLLLQVDDETICSVPVQWTDLVARDPETVLGEHRAPLRVEDLVQLERLVTRITRRERGEDSL